MVRRLRGLVAVGACIVAGGVACDRAPTAPDPPAAPSTVTVAFGGRVVDADAGAPVGDVRISAAAMSYAVAPEGWGRPNDSATSRPDGTFTLSLNLPSSWRFVSLRLTGPPGYDQREQRFEPPTAADRPAIRVYPTLVIRPGESIDVRVDTDIRVCGSALVDLVACRSVVVEAPPGEPVELEVVSDDRTKPMALSLEELFGGPDDMSVRRLTVPPGSVPCIFGAGTARLTARR